MKVKKINGLEKLFWDAEVKNKPGDTTQALAYTDWLIDHGFTLMGAKRHVSMLVRQGNEELQRQRIEKLLTGDGIEASRARRACRMACGVSRDLTYTIEVLAGGNAPERVGDLGYYMVENTGHVAADGEILDPNLEWEWVYGPVKIVVGAAWVVNALANRPAYLVI